MPEDYAALARLLLRAEGVASSFIEGVSAPILDIVLAETINRLRTKFCSCSADPGLSRKRPRHRL